MQLRHRQVQLQQPERDRGHHEGWDARAPSGDLRYASAAHMKQLHAPWRMTYILSEDKAPECIFCAYPARGAAHFREHHILVAKEHAFVIMNKYPYGNGHVMVVPRRHVAHPDQMEPAEWNATSELVRATVSAIGRALRCE